MIFYVQNCNTKVLNILKILLPYTYAKLQYSKLCSFFLIFIKLIRNTVYRLEIGKLKDKSRQDTYDYLTNIFQSKFSVNRTLNSFLNNYNCLKNLPNKFQVLKHSDKPFKAEQLRIPVS